MHAAGKSGSTDRECVMVAKARNRRMALAKKAPPRPYPLPPELTKKVKVAESAKTATAFNERIRENEKTKKMGKK